MKCPTLLALAFALMGAACDETPGSSMSPPDGAAAQDAMATNTAPSPDGGRVDLGLAAETGAGIDGSNVDCMPQTHPGTVTFVDEDAGTSTVDTADKVPDSIKWYQTNAGRVAVVKVVKHMLPNGAIELLLYGTCGQLLGIVLGMT
jgi:hypothetical protein